MVTAIVSDGTAFVEQREREMGDERVQVTLTHDESLVLFELLSRGQEVERLTVEGRAEEVVLSRLLGLLEKALVAPFQRDYAEQLKRARDRLREEAGDV